MAEDGRSKVYTDPDGRVWDTVAFRKLATATYVRFLLERNNMRLLLQFGTVDPSDPNLIAWSWQEMLTPPDACLLAAELAGAASMSARAGESIMTSLVANAVSLEARVVQMAGEIKGLKDKEGKPDATG